MSKEILYTESLQIGYPGTPIATGNAIRLKKGKLTAIIGINGSGKTTLLRTLAGELPPQSGEVYLFDKAIGQFSHKERAKHIGLVLSNPVFSEHLSVYEVVALGRHPYTNWLGLLSDRDKEAVNQALWKVGISDLATQICSELSDGQLQKVFIARALAQNTALIVLDEPTNHLDLYHKAFVFKLLKQLTLNTQKAIVFATHELNLALQLCDSLVLVHQENFIQAAPQKLIDSGALTQLFDGDLIQFDKESGTFKVNP